MAIDPILRPWRALDTLGRQRGYVTWAELREVIPVEAWDERFEEIAVVLHEQGIQIIADKAGDAEPATPTPLMGPLPPLKALLSDEPEGSGREKSLAGGVRRRPQMVTKFH